MAIRNSATEAEVILAVRNYLGSLDTREIALLPPIIISVGLDHARDIAQAALELARREAGALSDAPEAKVLKEAATVFSTAAMRLAVLCFGQESNVA
jgi:hypothetical protein